MTSDNRYTSKAAIRADKQRLDEELEREGLSPDQRAARLRVSVSTVRKWMYQRRRNYGK